MNRDTDFYPDDEFEDEPEDGEEEEEDDGYPIFQTNEQLNNPDKNQFGPEFAEQQEMNNMGKTQYRQNGLLQTLERLGIANEINIFEFDREILPTYCEIFVPVGDPRMAKKFGLYAPIAQFDWSNVGMCWIRRTDNGDELLEQINAVKRRHLNILKQYPGFYNQWFAMGARWN